MTIVEKFELEELSMEREGKRPYQFYYPSLGPFYYEVSQVLVCLPFWRKGKCQRIFLITVLQRTVYIVNCHLMVVIER